MYPEHYIETGELFAYQQGKHVKNKGLLDNEEFNNSCQEWLRQQKPESRSPGALKSYIESSLFSETPNIGKSTISERTCQRYMHLLKYNYKKRKKGVYYDGFFNPFFFSLHYVDQVMSDQM